MVTAYYLSDIVRKFWEDRLDGRITWLASPMHQFETVFEGLDSLQASAEASPVSTEEG